MGSAQSQPIADKVNGSGFLQQLKYQIEQDSKFFGKIKIYRHCLPPYPYFLKASIVLDSNDPNTVQRINLIKNNIEHDNNVQIHNIEILENILVCSQDTKIEFFCKYYSFTIGDAIQLRNKNDEFHKQSVSTQFNNRQQSQAFMGILGKQNKKQKHKIVHRLGYNKLSNNQFNNQGILTSQDLKRIKQNYFVQGDIWYALCSLTSFAKSYHELFKCQFGKFNISQIFLSPEGFIKVYQFLHLFQAKQLSCCAQNNNETKKNSIFMSEKEMLLPIRQRKQSKYPEYLQKISDVFDIGIIILSLICLQDLSNLSAVPYKYASIANVINTIQHLNIYDITLLNIVHKMLLPSSQRISLGQLDKCLPEINNKKINYKDRKAVEKFLNENSAINHRFTMHRPQSKFIINTMQTDAGYIKNNQVSQKNTSINRTPQVDPFSIETSQRMKFVRQNKYE